MRLSSIFSSDTLDWRPKRRLLPWLLVICTLLLLEGALRAREKPLLSRPNKWGHAKIQDLVDRYGARAASKKPLDVVIFGTSQGYTWVDQSDLNANGIATINASIPGANLAVSHLLAHRVLFDQIMPKLVVVAVGPMSLARWNEHLVEIVRNSPTGGAYLEDRRLSLWVQQNVELVRSGGHRLNAGLLAEIRGLLVSDAGSARSKRRKDADTLQSPERQLALRPLERSQQQFDALQALLEEAEKRGARTAIINMPVCEGGKHNRVWTYAEYREAMLRVIGERPLLDLDPLANESYFSDCVHPLPRGVAAFRAQIAAFLAAQLGREAARSPNAVTDLHSASQSAP